MKTTLPHCAGTRKRWAQPITASWRRWIVCGQMAWKSTVTTSAVTDWNSFGLAADDCTCEYRNYLKVSSIWVSSSFAYLKEHRIKAIYVILSLLGNPPTAWVRYLPRAMASYDWYSHALDSTWLSGSCCSMVSMGSEHWFFIKVVELNLLVDELRLCCRGSCTSKNWYRPALMLRP